MHYFTHEDQIAAVENPTQAAKYEQAGWEPVTQEAFCAAWHERDRAAIAALWEGLARRRPSAPLARAVGALPPGYVLPAGW